MNLNNIDPKYNWNIHEISIHSNSKPNFGYCLVTTVEVEIKSNFVQFKVKLWFYKFLTWQESQGEIPSHINIYQTFNQKLQILRHNYRFWISNTSFKKLEARNNIWKIFYTWKSFLKPWKCLRMKGLRIHFIHNFFSHTCTTIPGGTNLAQSWLDSWESLHWKKLDL